mgnify:CR=1 FL=1
MPNSSNDYIHRIGRTARAGKNGTAISFVSSGDHTEFRNICKEKSLNIEKMPLPDVKVLPVKISAPSKGKKFIHKGGGRKSQGHFKVNNRNKKFRLRRDFSQRNRRRY